MRHERHDPSRPPAAVEVGGTIEGMESGADDLGRVADVMQPRGDDEGFTIVFGYGGPEFLRAHGNANRVPPTRLEIAEQVLRERPGEVDADTCHGRAHAPTLFSVDVPGQGVSPRSSRIIHLSWYNAVGSALAVRRLVRYVVSASLRRVDSIPCRNPCVRSIESSGFGSRGIESPGLGSRGIESSGLGSRGIESRECRRRGASSPV